MLPLRYFVVPLFGVILWIARLQCENFGVVSLKFASAITAASSCWTRSFQHVFLSNNNARRRPNPLNVLLIYPDDWRHDSLGSADRNHIVETPYLDALAAEGLRFTHNCVTTSICWVSRATLFTGQFLSRHHSKNLSEPIFCDDSRWKDSWPAVLQHHHNYFVGHIGKWQFHNFDMVRERLFNWTSLHEGHHSYILNGTTVRAASRTRDDAIRFLRERPMDRPFALTLAFYPPKAIDNFSSEPGGQLFPTPHDRSRYSNVTIPEPYGGRQNCAGLPGFLNSTANEARRRWKQRYATSAQYQEHMKRYYALITEVDRAAKETIDELKRQGIYDETLIIFTTDNGMFHSTHGLAGKWFPYQESIRVPLIIRDPRMPERIRGTTDDSFTLNLDLAETILGAAGGVKAPKAMQGRNIADLYLSGERDPQPQKHSTDNPSPWRDEFFYEFHSLGKDFVTASTALVRKDYKYMRWPEWNNHELLFHLSDDPLEQINVVTKPENKAIVSEMRRRHDELLEAAK